MAALQFLTLTPYMNNHLLRILAEEQERSLSQHDGIRLVGIDLKFFPTEAIELIKDSAQRLSLQRNALTTLPASFQMMTKLKYLDLHQNRLKSVPEVLCSLPSLEILDLSGNSIDQLPKNLGSLKDLRVLSLKSNSFQYLSPQISEMSSLRILEVSENPLIMPTVNLINQIQTHNERGWIEDLKGYLLKESAVLESKINGSREEEPTNISPLQARARSNSENFVSTRASKRMGFIMKRAVETESLSSTISEAPELEQHSNGARKPSDTFPRRGSASGIKLMTIARKMLFVISEIHSLVKRLNESCVDKNLAHKMVSFLYSCKANVDVLVDALGQEEKGLKSTAIITSINSAVSSFKSVLKFLKDNIQFYFQDSNTFLIRSLYTCIFGSFCELFNCAKVLHPALKPRQPIMNTHNRSAPPPPLRLDTSLTIPPEQTDGDGPLFDCISNATLCAQTVFSQLTSAISKSAMASAQSSENRTINPAVAVKARELTSCCVSAMEVTKRLKARLNTIKGEDSLMERRRFWEDINSFLRAIINILATSKSAMGDLPTLNEVRASMATLTKATKDVTLRLEVSSFKHMANDLPPLSSTTAFNNNPPPLSAFPSVTNMATLPHHAPVSVTTPLLASLGPAAHAVLPSAGLPSPYSNVNPFDNLVDKG